jgi:hypothetical protein
MFSEVIQTQNNKYHILSFICMTPIYKKIINIKEGLFVGEPMRGGKGKDTEEGKYICIYRNIINRFFKIFCTCIINVYYFKMQ